MRGGAGAVEAVIAVLSLRDQTLPPTLTTAELDPDCSPLDLVTRVRSASLTIVMSNSFGFGGCNTSLIFGSAP